MLQGRRWSKIGSATSDLLWVIALLIGLGIIWYATGGPGRFQSFRGPFINPPPPLGSGEIYRPGDTPSALPPNYISPSSSQSEVPTSARSEWYGMVSVNIGSAAREFQSNREYIILEAARGNATPINVTGWSLTNGKARPDGVVIPNATRLFIGGGSNYQNSPISLAPGGRAVITTGSIPSTGSYPINVNFLTNKCSGYLASSPYSSSYTNFIPPLARSCPAPIAEVGVNNLEKDCYNFVKRLAACHTPEVKRNTQGDLSVDGIYSLPTACRNYLEQHFNYNACVGWHQNDSGFYGTEWRVFLNRPQELWSDNRERITLYDNLFKVVAVKTY